MSNPRMNPGASVSDDPRGRQSRRFNNTTGAISWGYRSAGLHPDRCICQADDATPHKHYPESPFACARCECAFYSPVWPDRGGNVSPRGGDGPIHPLAKAVGRPGTIL